MSADENAGSVARSRLAHTRIAVLAGFGLLAALQWSTLVADPPVARLFGVAIAVTLTAALLNLLGRPNISAPGSRPRRAGHRVAVIAVVLAGTVVALLLVGVPARTLPPAGWDRLAGGIDVGLQGLSGPFEYPLRGGGDWSRLLLVAPIVPLLLVGAVLAFRPGRPPDRPPIAALVVLIAAFAVPAVARPTGAPVLWGAALLLLAAAWLWGERVRTLPALAMIACFAGVAIPVATSVAGSEPPIDYREWSIPGSSDGVSFDWSQTYGPIDWPRTGEPVLRVHSDRANFWRAQILDEFYGDAWRRSGGVGGLPVPAEPRAGSSRAGTGRDWLQKARFELLALESPVVISPGRALKVDGIGAVESAADGTARSEHGQLTPGTEYSVQAYAPDPRPVRLRAGSQRYRQPLSPYTSLALPDDASLESIYAPVRISVPLWGDQRGRFGARQALADSAYGQVAQLAERLTAGTDNAYDAAVAIEGHLRSDYVYDERPPRRRLPLRAFIFRDRFGYCQQFSGAMALMLRMVGIPARVAAGFAPGTPTSGGHGFVVTDLDAHAWVEVYFNGIGWVPFDPTPPIGPASYPDVRGGASFALGAGSFPAFDSPGKSGDRRAGDPASAGAPAEGGGGGLPVSPLTGLAAIAALALVAPLRAIRHRRLPPPLAEQREIEELRAALRATGWSKRDSTTLLVAERRLSAARLTAASTYVRRFRARRYSAEGEPGPTPAERRSARRELATGGRRSRRLRMLLLMPPGGPRRVSPSNGR